MLYIVEGCVMAYAEVVDLVERKRESGDQVVVGGEYNTVAQAIKHFQQLIKSTDFAELDEVHVIANSGSYLAAAIIIGADFTWALDLY